MKISATPLHLQYSSIASYYNETLAKIGLTAAPEKDMNHATVIHPGFEFDSVKMEVYLPRNEHSTVVPCTPLQTRSKQSSYHIQCWMKLSAFYFIAVKLSSRDILFSAMSFPRSVAFSLLIYFASTYLARQRRTFDSGLYFSFWFTISVIQLSRINHDVAIDASGKKGIGGIYNNKHSIIGAVLRPLQTILLLAALFDIKLSAFWILSEENMVADAASPHQFDKCANLVFQDQVASLHRKTPVTKISVLRQKLHSNSSTRSNPPPDVTTIRQDNHKNPCTPSINTHPPILTVSTSNTPSTWQLPDSCCEFTRNS